MSEQSNVNASAVPSIPIECLTDCFSDEDGAPRSHGLNGKFVRNRDNEVAPSVVPQRKVREKSWQWSRSVSGLCFEPYV